MKDLNEKEVLKLLYNYNNDTNPLENIPDYPLLDKQFVKQVSKSITDILYDSYSTNNSSSKKTKDIFLELLSRWTSTNSHLSIDETNYAHFIKFLNKQQSSEDSTFNKYQQNLLDTFEDAESLKPQNNWKNICETVNNKYKTQIENKIKSGLIQVWNVTQLNKTSFEYNPPTKTFQNYDTERSIDILNELKETVAIKHETKINSTNIQNKSLNSTCNDEDNTRINLIYSLINLERTEENEKLLNNLIHELSKFKSDDSIKFIDTIWHRKDHYNLPYETRITVLKKFEHIYEKILLSLATEVLKNFDLNTCDSEYEELISKSELIELINFCKTNSELSRNIICVLNQISVLSNFDKCILIFTNKIMSGLY